MSSQSICELRWDQQHTYFGATMFDIITFLPTLIEIYLIEHRPDVDFDDFEVLKKKVIDNAYETECKYIDEYYSEDEIVQKVEEAFKPLIDIAKSCIV